MKSYVLESKRNGPARQGLTDTTLHNAPLRTIDATGEGGRGISTNLIFDIRT